MDPDTVKAVADFFQSLEGAAMAIGTAVAAGALAFKRVRAALAKMFGPKKDTDNVA